MNKKLLFIGLVVLVAIAIILVAVFLIDPPEDNIPDELESYVAPEKENGANQGNSGGLHVEQDNSGGKYGEMREPE